LITPISIRSHRADQHSTTLTGISITLIASPPRDVSLFQWALGYGQGDLRLTEGRAGTVVGLAGAVANTGRVRALLEGSRMFALGENRAIEPTLEFGLRHDSGDAETGSGFQRWRLGKRWELGTQLQMSVEGERNEFELMDPDHAISVQGLLLW